MWSRAAMPGYEQLAEGATAPVSPGIPVTAKLRWAVLGAALATLALCVHGWAGLSSPSLVEAPPSLLLARPAEVVVKVGQGSVRGLQTSWYGRRFLGIPYGKARRFRNPLPPDEITGELDARHFSTSCMRSIAHYRENMSEDCLHLNVYTPIPWKNDATLKVPALVWFHGGSFTMGAGSDTHIEDVQELVTTRRLVVVTINYRLGVFGFLGSERLRAHGDSSVGNFGTLDQQQALRWVRDNIAYFGGDPEKIGLLGWSAGAASISAHLSMPTSAGLFHAAIMMSGGFTDWAAQSMSSAEEKYDDVLRVTGCFESQGCHSPGPPCPCLLNKTAEELVAAEDKVPATWAPTVDGTHLAKHPMEAVFAGEVLKGIPIIIGGALEDALNDIGANATEADLERYLTTPATGGGVGLSAPLAREAAALYMGLPPPTEHGLDRWSPAYWAARRARADGTMNCVARRAAAAWRTKAGADAHWYVWAAEPLHRYPDPPQKDPAAPFSIGGCWPCPGTTHGSDLPYLFEHNTVNVDDSTSDLADLYQVFFRNFVYARDPNQWKGEFLSQYRGGSHQLMKAWPPVAEGGMKFEVGSMRVAPDLKSEECAFWDRVAAR